jgi:hypothetical protein
MSMTPAQARVVDPVLTTHAQGYRHPDYVGSLLFPAVDVGPRGGKVIEFGKESFKLYNLRRAPGADARRVTFGYQGKPFQLVQDSVDVPLPREVYDDAKMGPSVDLGMRAVGHAVRVMTLPLESEQATLAADAANYDASHKDDLSGGDEWSVSTVDPIAAIDVAKEAIRATTGMYPNVMVIGAVAWPALKNNPFVVDRVKCTSRDSVTAEIIANVLGLERLGIGKAVIADDAGTFSDVWGNVAVLAYAPQSGSAAEEPSFGYTYRLQGHPFVDQPWFEQQSRSWIYSANYERLPVLTGITAGFLFQNVTA